MNAQQQTEALDRLREYTQVNPMTLASGSPRRQELLEKMGLTFHVIRPTLDESGVKAIGPRSLVKRLSKLKAREVHARVHGPLTLAADTVVYLRGKILGKPKDEAEARDMLRRLSGRTHQVFTGVTVICGTDVDGFYRAERTFYARTAVKFRPLTDRQIAEYVATGEPMDKAGAYGIQCEGRALVESIRGSFDNVMGLPTEALIPFIYDGFWRQLFI